MRLTGVASSSIIWMVVLLYACELHHSVGVPSSAQRPTAHGNAARHTSGRSRVDAAFELLPLRMPAKGVLTAPVRTALLGYPEVAAVSFEPGTHDGFVALSTAPNVALATRRSLEPWPHTACFAVVRTAPLASVHTDAEIAASIREQLRKSPFLDDSTIFVSVTAGRAVLTGEVATAAERSLATQCALRGGAQEVDNRLHVVASRAAA